jgi:N,N'-diacetyllegionaminate synthase
MICPPLHIIAEAGTNHGGELSKAKKLVDIAKDACAHSVKFQIINPDGLYLRKLWDGDELKDNEVFNLRESQRLSDEGWKECAAYCNEKGISLSASVFVSRSLDLLDSFNPPYIKIASCDLNNHPLIEEVAERGRTIILSTGMSNLKEMEKSVKVVESAGNAKLVLLHCVSIYPSPIEMMNLDFIDTLKSNFGVEVGLSDHSESSLAAAIAVSKGVSWFEKHFTYDRGANGFDHAYAMEPNMLAQYVTDLQDCYKACQPKEIKLSETELIVRQRARRSLYAARALKQGHILTKDDILIVRPEGPLAPSQLKDLVGQTLSRDIKGYQPFNNDDLE